MSDIFVAVNDGCFCRPLENAPKLGSFSKVLFLGLWKENSHSLNYISLVTSTAATSILLLFNYTSSHADYWHWQVLLDLVQLPSHQGRFGLGL